VAQALIENATLRAIEEQLRSLDGDATEPGRSKLRTRVMTHTAWVPPRWEEAARGVLAGFGDRHPSRTILLFPDPESDRDALDAEVDVRLFGKGGVEGSIASEVIAIWLRGRRAAAPASVVQPLLVSDLPAFLRWRGTLPFGASELEQLAGVIDRLIVDGREWDDLEAIYRRLPELFPRIAVSDLAWSRLLPWREAIAGLWPGVAETAQVRVSGPRAEALLLAGWLRGRLRREVTLVHAPREELEGVALDGREVHPSYHDERSPSDLLSAEFEIYGRDPIFEEAVASLA
jgi:glucose-6-phosphate dehydrogenase assembly protein OpcA